MRTTRLLSSLVLAAGLAGLTGLVAAPALAYPSTTPAYPQAASATFFSGAAFDQCTAPSAAAMDAWTDSPYDAAGIYISGAARSCAQPQLTASWVTTVSGLGWKLIPIHVGLQAPCNTSPTRPKITPSKAEAQGQDAANEAIAAATALGLRPGSAIYNDMENYPTTSSTCRTAVLNYLSGWTKRLHFKGYVSGVYVNLTTGAAQLNANYLSTTLARPDAIWIARYDGNATLTGWSGVDDSHWPFYQRAKQYLANQSETYGGTTIVVDRNIFRAPVATVAYTHAVTATTTLTARSTPFTSGSAVTTYQPGAQVQIACQTAGSGQGTSKVWDKLTTGAYVPDFFIDTPSNTSYSSPIARCTFPYQVSAAKGVTTRTGPGTSYKSGGTIATGGLAYIACQKAGTKVASTKVWDKLVDGRWVSDSAIATPSSTSWSAPIPRC